MSVHDEIRQWWDDDAATYDATHRPRSAAEQAAWTAVLGALLPAPPARVLDCGAGTGLLSLSAGSLGHDVTAVDLSGRMLSHLARSAEDRGLRVRTVEGRADQVPSPPYDAVMERHLLWTLPNPEATLGAWRAATVPGGRLILLGVVSEPPARRRARRWIDRWNRRPPRHHGEYPASLRAALPLARGGMSPSRFAELAEQAGWEAPQLLRLADVEWAEKLSLPAAERMLGTPARFAVVAENKATSPAP